MSPRPASKQIPKINKNYKFSMARAPGHTLLNMKKKEEVRRAAAVRPSPVVQMRRSEYAVSPISLAVA
jgi:hypothetical protein